MKFMEKIKAIYEYALHGDLIKNPWKLMDGKRILMIVKYLTKHDYDFIEIEALFQ